jgi:hypothetical protein
MNILKTINEFIIVETIAASSVLACTVYIERMN